MTETRAEYDKPRQHYMRCECGHRLAWINGAGDIVSTTPAQFKRHGASVVIQCQNCGKWIRIYEERK